MVASSTLVTPSPNEYWSHSTGVPPPSLLHRKCCITPTLHCLPSPLLLAVLTHSLTNSPTVVRLHFDPLPLQVHDGSVRRQHLPWISFLLVTDSKWTGPELTLQLTSRRLDSRTAKCLAGEHYGSSTSTNDLKFVGATFETSATCWSVGNCPCRWTPETTSWFELQNKTPWHQFSLDQVFRF